MKKPLIIASFAALSSLIGVPSVLANKIMISDSYSDRYHGYPTYSECKSDHGYGYECKWISDDCNDYEIYVESYDFDELWSDYNAGGTIHVYMADDDGDHIYNLCSLAK